MSYERDIQIDPDALDVEWVEQAQKTMKYSKIAAAAERDRDLAKEELDFIKAELDRKVREAPEYYNILVKVTETVIFNTVIAQPEYRQAYAKFVDATFEAKVASGASWAFQDRKAALENLVKLHGQDYFAGPSVPRDLSKEWEDKQRQRKVDSGIADKLKRRRK